MKAAAAALVVWMVVGVAFGVAVAGELLLLTHCFRPHAPRFLTNILTVTATATPKPTPIVIVIVIITLFHITNVTAVIITMCSTGHVLFDRFDPHVSDIQPK